MKGFDYLSPNGFYDAIKAYGLPASIIAFDQAALENVSCSFRTAYGLTEPLIINGVTKQGGPLSPIKSTLTTGMGHLWLNDFLKDNPDRLVVSSMNKGYGNPHTPWESEQLILTTVEATDDSITFAKTMKTLKESTLKMERFQYAYNWTTSWGKSKLYILNEKTDQGNQTSAEIWSIDKESPWDETKHVTHMVQVSRGEFQFLNVSINNSNARFQELLNIIKTFHFSRMSVRPPITLLNRTITTVLLPKLRALLTLQPLDRKHSVLLDKEIGKKVFEEIRTRYTPSLKILTLPTTLFGMGFPSVRRLNDALAIDGLLRDLNHRIDAYRKMARITMSDWTCQYNGCLDPFSTYGIHNRPFKTITWDKKLPITWTLAREAMKEIGGDLVIRKTDYSSWKDNGVSLKHIRNCLESNERAKTRVRQSKTSRDQKPNWIPNTRLLTTADKYGLAWSSDFGIWADNGKFSFREDPDTQTKLNRVPKPTRSNIYDGVKNLLAKADLPILVDIPMDLALSRVQRESRAKSLIECHVAQGCKRDNNPSGVIATDGSMVPANAKLHQVRSVTAAMIGTRSAAWRMEGRAKSIQHGEIFALIAAHINTNTRSIITDHLNAIRMVEVNEQVFHRKVDKMNGRALYRWLFDLRKQRPIPLTHVRSHTGNGDSNSKLNEEADQLASGAINGRAWTPPEVTFKMDEYMLFSPVDGYIEINPTKYVIHMLSEVEARQMEEGTSLRMARSLYHQFDPPDRLYLKSTSAYSIAVQLLTRSGQLDTMYTRWKRGIGSNNHGKCEYGCGMLQDEHHIFVICPYFSDMRREANKMIADGTEKLLKKVDIDEGQKDQFRIIAKSLLYDNVIWPLQQSRFYLGFVPPMNHIQNDMDRKEKLNIKHSLAIIWHTEMIKLCGRIWGSIMRERDRKWSVEKETDWKK
ncbi:hypothetical protein FRC16_004910, partial [Serendipita sp. 398]